MENTKNYVIAEVGFEALFEAMVAQAEADIMKFENVKQELGAKPFGNTYFLVNKKELKRKDVLLLAQTRELAEDARQGLADWLKVLKVLDIADAVIG